MERKIGLVFSFIGITVMAVCMFNAAYKTAPLAAMVLDGLFISVIGIFIANLENNRD